MTTFDARVETWRGDDTDDATIAKVFHGSRCSGCSRPLVKGRWSFSTDDGLPVCTACTHVCSVCHERLVPRFWRTIDGEAWCRDCQRLTAQVAAECHALADRRRRIAAARSVVAAALATPKPGPRISGDAARNSRPPGWVPDDLTLARSRRHWRTIDAAFAAAAGQTQLPLGRGDRARRVDADVDQRPPVSAAAGQSRRRTRNGPTGRVGPGDLAALARVAAATRAAGGRATP